MARSSGNLNPDSKAGNARLGVGRGSNAGRSQPIAKGKLPTPKKFGPPAGGKSINLTELFKSGQWKSKPAGYQGTRMSSAEEMRILQKASRGTRAARGGINGIRAGTNKIGR